MSGRPEGGGHQVFDAGAVPGIEWGRQIVAVLGEAGTVRQMFFGHGEHGVLTVPGMGEDAVLRAVQEFLDDQHRIAHQFGGQERGIRHITQQMHPLAAGTGARLGDAWEADLLGGGHQMRHPVALLEPDGGTGELIDLAAQRHFVREIRDGGVRIARKPQGLVHSRGDQRTGLREAEHRHPGGIRGQLPDRHQQPWVIQPVHG